MHAMREAEERCPTTLALELFLAVPARSGAGRHVAACAACREEVAEMRRVGDEFLRRVYPRTRAAIARAAAPQDGYGWPQGACGSEPGPAQASGTIGARLRPTAPAAAA